MQTTHEISAEIIRRWDELARDGVINREETIRQIVEQMLNASARCVYCNNLFKLNTPEEKEAIVTHVMSCDKNPMTAIYQQAKEICETDAKFKEANEAYIKTLERNNEDLTKTEAKHFALIAKHNAITEMISRFLVPHRTQLARCWLDSFVECGAVTIDWTYPHGYVAPVKL